MRIPKSVLRVPALLEPSLGNTGDGQTYGPAVLIRGGFDPDARVVLDGNGRTLHVTAALTLAPDTPVKAGDRITVAGVAYDVLRRNPAYVGARVHHVEAWLA